MFMSEGTCLFPLDPCIQLVCAPGGVAAGQRTGSADPAALSEIGGSIGCNLMQLDLQHNSLRGPLPMELLINSPQLQRLNFAYNFMTGT